ncbi:GGDEF domain-containing protein [Rhodoferax ferrireducens]|uniref:GGDEF domain-containing protein n=1 Tax=Rhodoferax ferrireducens TaxID=192843 RepID=UPI000E0DCA79|nr:GGDEF domain-containing protein [Rhodoferax ferrireducens]
MALTSRLDTPMESLGARLVLATLSFCLVFTLLAIAVLTLSAWKVGVAAMTSELTQIEQVYQATLSKSIWEMDRESLQTHLDSAASVPAVGQVTLKITSANRAPEILVRTSAGWSASSWAPTRRLALVYEPYPGARETLGELALYGDERVLWARLRGEVSTIIVTQVVQSLLLAGLIMLMFTRLVTVHVQRIASHLGQLAPSNLGQALVLNRKKLHHDELTLLVTGVNQLQGSLAEYLAKQQRFEHELAEHRDRLAGLVQERTAELEALSAAQHVVLTLSNRLIHAPLAEFDHYNFECLRDIAQRLDASDALWYVLEPNGTEYRVFLAWHANASPVPLAEPLRVGGWPRLLDELARDDLLTFPSQAALANSITPGEAAPFAALRLEATAFAMLRGVDEQFGFLVFGKRMAVSSWRSDELALLAMTSQMLLQSARHKAQLVDISETQHALQTANTRLENLSRTDPLTELPNRRHFDEVKETEFRRARRTGQPLSLLICDIDFFKGYNDTYGHALGDQCLCAVAGALRASLRRAGDLVARIGGEEFAVLLPAATQETALKLAEYFRQAVADLTILHAASSVAGHVTISIGLAVLAADGVDNFDALFKQADQALYRAKAGGRNRVVCAVPVKDILDEKEES